MAGHAGTGATVACIASKAAECRDAGSGLARDAVVSTCLPPYDGGISDGGAEACNFRCDTARTNCHAACPVTTWGVCYPCVKDCGLKVARCYSGC